MGPVIIVFLVLSYVVGSIPTADLFTRHFKNIDIFKSGSGKMGATNVIRTTKDTLLGIVTGGFDGVVKGSFWMLAVHYTFVVGLDIPWMMPVCATLVLLGHVFPVFTRFRGGGGIATSIGISSVLMPGLNFFLAIIAWIWAFQASKGIRSLCNITAVAVLFLSGALFSFSWQFLVFAIIAIILVLLGHRTNIKRIRKGEEERSTWEGMAHGLTRLWQSDEAKELLKKVKNKTK